jgi:hypothetical protein
LGKDPLHPYGSLRTSTGNAENRRFSVEVREGLYRALHPTAPFERGGLD